MSFPRYEVERKIEWPLEPLHKANRPMQIALFMSDDGSIAVPVVEEYLRQRDSGKPSFKPIMIVTDNPDSNAMQIAGKWFADQKFNLPAWSVSVHGFYAERGLDDIVDMDVRKKFDSELKKPLSFGRDWADCYVLAGYHRMVTHVISNHLTINFHLGDLRVRDENNQPKYKGRGWVPSALAMLAGENKVHSTVHLVNERMDEGKILAVSNFYPIPDEVNEMSVEERAKLLGYAKTPWDIFEIERKKSMSEAQLAETFPIYHFARDCERMLIEKTVKIFPQVINDIALGNFTRDIHGNLHYNGKPIQNGVEGEECSVKQKKI